MLNERLRRPGALKAVVFLLLVIGVFSVGELAWAAAPPADSVQSDFPRSLDSYQDADLGSIAAILVHRIKEGTLIFIYYPEAQYFSNSSIANHQFKEVVNG